MKCSFWQCLCEWIEWTLKTLHVKLNWADNCIHIKLKRQHSSHSMKQIMLTCQIQSMHCLLSESDIPTTMHGGQILDERWSFIPPLHMEHMCFEGTEKQVFARQTTQIIRVVHIIFFCFQFNSNFNMFIYLVSTVECPWF